MNIQWSSVKLVSLKTEALVIPLVADVPFDRIRGFDKELAQALNELNAHGDWKGEANEVDIFYSDSGSKISENFPGIKRFVLSGMGEQKDWTYEKMRRAIASAVTTLKARKIEECTLLLPENITSSTARDLATIVQMANYKFDSYKTNDKKEKKEILLEEVKMIAVSDKHSGSGFQKALDEGRVIGESTNYVRDLINHPSNVITPTHLAKDAEELADKEVAVEVYGRKECEKMGLDAFLAVAKGSNEEPKMIVIEYNPVIKDGKSKDLPLVALVGKGITFDTGGISIKPSEGMDEMKIDMSGSAACLGAVSAVKALQLPIHLVVVLMATENMPSGSAIKPGDIVKGYGGKTIEILNTDAEGRLVLADGVAYVAKRFKPDAIIDLATLTGACVVALGKEAAGLLGNNEKLIEKVKQAAARTGEKVWEMPYWDEYKEMIKSEVADLKNIGEGRQAGTITAAAFIGAFVPDEIPWAHLDIAGVARVEKARAYIPKGGSGWGVRLLVDLLEHWN